jgi:hypothetical protein
MKNRKNTFALAIVALILILGVGYAVVSSQTLTINGNATAKTETLKVVYDGNNGSSGANVTTLSAANGSTAATFAIENMVLNTAEYAEFEIVNNETDVNATIKVPTSAQFTNSNSTYFDAKLYYKGQGESDYTEWTTDKTLAHGDTAKIKVVVTLKATPVTSAQSSTTISVTYTAEPVAS